MLYKRLGRTGIRVSILGFGSTFLPGKTSAEAARLVGSAIECGVNYFDTAPAYGDGRADELLGLALRGRREGVALSTKVGYLGNRRDHRDFESLWEQVCSSLRRLRTDYVDVLQVHEADFLWWWTDKLSESDLQWPFALVETEAIRRIADAPIIRVLARAKEQGLARSVGLTGKNSGRLALLVEQLEPEVVMVAHQLNLLYRNAAEDLVPAVEARGFGISVGAPLMRGWLAKPESSWGKVMPEWMDVPFLRAYRACLRLAEVSGLSICELALRWLVSNDYVDSVVVGFASCKEVELNTGYILNGELPESVLLGAQNTGIIHPLIYQGRSEF